MKRELTKRVITGMILGAVVIGTTFAGTGPALVLIVLIVAGAAWEFFRIQSEKPVKSRFLLPYLFCLLPFLLYTGQIFIEEAVYLFEDPLSLFGMAGLAGMVVFLYLRKSDLSLTVRHLGMFALSILFFTIPGIFAAFVCELSSLLILSIFILIWSSDVFAYFGGKVFGRNKMAPGVSPNKTWEGFASGLLATATAAWLLSLLMPEVGISTLDWIVCGILVVVFGTMGDFFQSAVKRSAGVKDSGTILPGHGGMWDRFDSFLGCMPWVGMYFLLF